MRETLCLYSLDTFFTAILAMEPLFLACFWPHVLAVQTMREGLFVKFLVFEFFALALDED